MDSKLNDTRVWFRYLGSKMNVNSFIWVLRPLQEYFIYIKPIIHQRWVKTREPGEKPPDHP